jgi:hypothetical protein
MIAQVGQDARKWSGAQGVSGYDSYDVRHNGTILPVNHQYACYLRVVWVIHIGDQELMLPVGMSSSLFVVFEFSNDEFCEGRFRV